MTSSIDYPLTSNLTFSKDTDVIDDRTIAVEEHEVTWNPTTISVSPNTFANNNCYYSMNYEDTHSNDNHMNMSSANPNPHAHAHAHANHNNNLSVTPNSSMEEHPHGSMNNATISIRKSDVFVPDAGTNGGYSCRHCNTMPYSFRAPGSIW